MSYTRRFTKTIAVHYSGSVSYPASQNGGTAHYSGTEYEDVVVDIEVDTTPYDRGIEKCNNHINALTASVAATETAQVASVRENSTLISNTIINGFFKNIRSELSTQILELSQRVESKLMQLMEQKKLLLAKKEQMENDYSRTKARYVKLISDINRELEHRVRTLDQPVFDAANKIAAETDRLLECDCPEIATIAAKENAELNSQISASLAKSNARKAIAQMTEFLRAQRASDLTIQRSTISGLPSENASFYLPVCYYETVNAKGATESGIAFDKDMLPEYVNDEVMTTILANPGKAETLSQDKKKEIEGYLVQSINEKYAQSTNEHDVRVMNVINSLFFE